MASGRITAKIGMILLAIWLILYGIFGLTNLAFEFEGVIMAILALAAGVLILLDK